MSINNHVYFHKITWHSLHDSEICLYTYVAPITPKRWIGANDKIKIIYGVFCA